MRPLTSVVLICTGWRKMRTQDAPMIDLAFSEVESYHGPIAIVLEGGAGGADHLCRMEARKREIPCLSVYARWSQLGKSAGLRRNARMAAMASQLADLWNAGVVGAAFPHTTSTGTVDMMERIETLGWPLHVYRDFTREVVAS